LSYPQSELRPVRGRRQQPGAGRTYLPARSAGDWCRGRVLGSTWQFNTKSTNVTVFGITW